jgi:glycosyltransferase involved in cell wall biosynthesis
VVPANSSCIPLMVFRQQLKCNVMKKIKILEAIRHGKVGGGETHVIDLVTNLDKSVFEPIVLSFTDGPMIETLQNRGIKTYIIPTQNSLDIRVWDAVKELLIDEKINLVHAHGSRAMSNVFRGAELLNLPLLYTVHGWSFHSDQFSAIRKLLQKIEKFLTLKATTVICVSKSTEEEGRKLFGMNNSKLIYNAVDVNKFNPDKLYPDIRKNLNIPGDHFLIGYIARVTKQKNPIGLLYAFKKVLKSHPKSTLLIVGDGDLKKETIRIADSLNIKNNVRFEPFRSDIPDILNAIDVYCRPSFWEGFPIGIFEAMAMKKPVVVSAIPPHEEIIKDGLTGLIADHQSPDMFAASILQLAKDKKFSSELGENACRFIHSQFQLDTMISKIERLYYLSMNNYQLLLSSG